MEAIEHILKQFEKITVDIKSDLETPCENLSKDDLNIMQTRVLAVTSLKIWKNYLEYIQSSKERNRKLFLDVDTVKLCWN